MTLPPCSLIEHIEKLVESIEEFCQEGVHDLTDTGNVRYLYELGVTQPATIIRSKEREQRTARDAISMANNDSKYILRWSVEDKVTMMREGMRELFDRNAKFHSELLSTGMSIIKGAPDNDSFWGVGTDNRGVNMTGLLLMELRSELVELRSSESN